MLNLSWAGRRNGLDIQFANAGVLDSRITFSRTSNATMFDATGKLTYAPNNLITVSNTFSSWALVGVTATQDATGIDGKISAWTLTQTGANGSDSRIQFNASIPNNSANYVFSTYLKKATSAPTTYPGLQLALINGTPVSIVVVLNPFTGTYVTSGTPVTVTVNSDGDYWRVSVNTANNGSGNTLAALSIYPAYNSSGTTAFSPVNGGVSVATSAQFEIVTYETAARAYNATAGSAYYGPRFTYDPSTLSALGLMIEEARTNIQFYSGDLTNATGWAALSCTVANNGAAGPDGTKLMTRITSTLAGNRNQSAGTGMTTAASTTYTGSFYMRAGSSNFAGIVANGVGGVPTACGAIFTLTGNGSVVSTAGTGSPAGTIKKIATGLYRCTLTFTTGVGQTSTQFGAGVSDGTTYTSTIYPSAASGTIDADFAQLEVGPSETSYIPTTTASVTRAADSASFNNLAWFNAGAGTFIVDYIGGLDGSQSGYGRIIGYTGGGNPGFVVSNSLTTTLNFYNGTNSLAVTVTSSNYWLLGGKAGAAYDSAGRALCGNGQSVVTDANSIGTVSDLYLGRNGGASTNVMNGTIKRLTYYPRRLSNAEMQDLTT